MKPFPILKRINPITTNIFFLFIVLTSLFSLSASFFYFSKHNNCKNPTLKLFIFWTSFSTFSSLSNSDKSSMTCKTLFWSYSTIWSHIDKTIIVQSETWFNFITLLTLWWSLKVNSLQKFKTSLIVFICIGTNFVQRNECVE